MRAIIVVAAAVARAAVTISDGEDVWVEPVAAASVERTETVSVELLAVPLAVGLIGLLEIAGEGAKAVPEPDARDVTDVVVLLGSLAVPVALASAASGRTAGAGACAVPVAAAFDPTGFTVLSGSLAVAVAVAVTA